MGCAPSLNLSERLPARCAGAEDLGEKSPEYDGDGKTAPPLLTLGSQLPWRDPRLEELGQLREGSGPESFELGVEFLLSRARGAAEQDLMKPGEEWRCISHI